MKKNKSCSRHYQVFALSLIIVFVLLISPQFLYAQHFEWNNPPLQSENAVKSSVQLNYGEDDLGAFFNLQILNGDRSIYDKNEGFKTITTRQLSNATRLYENNVESVVLIGNGSGIGAGVIISRGEIITNYHVVEGAKDVDIVQYDSKNTSVKNISDNEVFAGRVVALDKKRDLALIQTDSKLKNIVSFGKDHRIKVAQDVFAIGHPAGLWGFTYGVISALPSPKEWTYNGSYYMNANCIQTQTPINPGNSGGPLFNKSGKLIGINTSTAEGEGLNFAVRLNEINDFIKRARNGEYPEGEEKEELVWKKIPDHGYEDVYAVYGTDRTGDGQFDYWLVYEDKDDDVDVRLYDFNGDGYIDSIHIISENNFYIDSDYDGNYDTVGIDTDGDGAPDEFKEYTKG